MLAVVSYHPSAEPPPLKYSRHPLVAALEEEDDSRRYVTDWDVLLLQRGHERMKAPICVKLQIRPDEIDGISLRNAALGPPLIKRPLHRIPQRRNRCIQIVRQQKRIRATQRGDNGAISNTVGFGEGALVLGFPGPGVRIDVIDDRPANRPVGIGSLAPIPQLNARLPRSRIIARDQLQARQVMQVLVLIILLVHRQNAFRQITHDLRDRRIIRGLRRFEIKILGQTKRRPQHTHQQ